MEHYRLVTHSGEVLFILGLSFLHNADKTVLSTCYLKFFFSINHMVEFALDAAKI